MCLSKENGEHFPIYKYIYIQYNERVEIYVVQAAKKYHVVGGMYFTSRYIWIKASAQQHKSVKKTYKSVYVCALFTGTSEQNWNLAIYWTMNILELELIENSYDPKFCWKFEKYDRIDRRIISFGLASVRYAQRSHCTMHIDTQYTCIDFIYFY